MTFASGMCCLVLQERFFHVLSVDLLSWVAETLTFQMRHSPSLHALTFACCPAARNMIRGWSRGVMHWPGPVGISKNWDK